LATEKVSGKTCPNNWGVDRESGQLAVEYSNVIWRTKEVLRN